MSNATARKFGYPDTLIAEVGPWLLLLRPKQPTLGSLVLVCTEDARAFGDLSGEAYAQLRDAVRGAERMLKGFVGYERINYLMLMMIDPDVHYHVIPRYAGSREFAAASYVDHGWPGPPALGETVDPGPAAQAELIAELRRRWAQPDPAA
ncbi:HIT family protein [Solimonas terrae]|uniref:HIT family protein n=1 Tax=Solimonas terrae TaxID=1396819 RepID=A0A6M2BMI3_9GAMM|nr:HIT family protein [Solimonas terrae]NGY03638.1 HIT family protein [Solimonas terrae]